MKWTRTAVLSVLIVTLIAFGLPVRESLARWSRRAAVAHRRGNHRLCRHSRAWWRRHRARTKERQERARLRRQQREAQIRQGFSGGTRDAGAATAAALKSGGDAATRRALRKNLAAAETPRVQGPQNPYDFALPASWSLARAQTPGAISFAVGASGGKKSASRATLAPVVLSTSSAAADVVSPRTKTLGGVALPALRRTVIDRMIVEGGWILNDMEREVGGRRVYVVVAQTGGGGTARESWTFYFTEIEGRLYSLATNVPVEQAAPVAVDAEQVMATLHRGGSKALTANSKR